MTDTISPNELYNRMPEDSYFGCDYFIGCYYNHVPELEIHEHELDYDSIQKDELLMIKVYKHFDFDGRRFWRLASVWFDNTPIMILRNAGREGDDHADRFITDEYGYRKMVEYLFTKVRKQEIPDVVDPNEPIKDLTAFYGNNLTGRFERYYF